jgi:hypothetical protein
LEDEKSGQKPCQTTKKIRKYMKIDMHINTRANLKIGPISHLNAPANSMPQRDSGT